MLRFTLILAAVAVTGLAYADVYKTVDAAGQVHYSDQWSPGAELIKGDRPRFAADGSPAPAESSGNPAPANTPPQSAQQASAADTAAARADDCKKLQDQYAKLLHARRIIKADSSPTDPQYMTDTEADAERAKTKSDMDWACGTAQPAT